MDSVTSGDTGESASVGPEASGRMPGDGAPDRTPGEGAPDRTPADRMPGDGAPAGSLRSQTSPAIRRWIWVLEHAQDIVAVTVGVVLVLLAAVLLVSGVVDFLDGANGSISAAAPQLLDRVLLVLILIEIVHTVVLSLRAHRLVAQPFIVVGLIAVIRRILVVLTPGGPKVGAAELGLLIGMIAVFVAGLIAVSLVEKAADGSQENPPI